MMDVLESWPEVLFSINGFLGGAKALPPVIIVLLAAPCAISVLFRSALAFGLTALQFLLSIAAVQGQTAVPSQWSIALMTVVAGALSISQVGRLRRARRQVSLAEFGLIEAKNEVKDVRERLHREVYWRSATEERSAS